MRPLLRYVLRAAVFAMLVVSGLHCEGTVQANNELMPIEIDGVRLDVEVVSNPTTRNRGLMFRESLPEDQGMLFVWPGAEQRSFWMKNCLIPLDVGFFDASSRLINVQTMEPDGGRGTWSSHGPALYAVETNAGWYERNNIRDGALLVLPRSVTAVE